ncbi:hypothetical protein LR68_02889 [Anoxybacillus sp. BCO1]|nr:hypothetical protein LR68_02889 [Anoxybacillus sp. BCO1]
MFGGSPINVAVPPMFEKSTSEIKNGTGSTSNIRVMENVTGTINKTVVTLSKKAERTAVSKDKMTKMLIGLPFAIFAALTATYWKKPDLLVMLTRIIIPIKSVIVPTRYDECTLDVNQRCRK